MKTKLILPLVALATLASFTVPAHASSRSDKAALAIGGFIGGVIVGSHLDKNSSRHHGHVTHVQSCPPPVSYGHGHGRGHTRVIIQHGPSRPSGYWTNVTERVWIPRERIVSYDDCGRRTIRLVGGYYETYTRRVWIAQGHPRYAGRW